MKSISKLLWIHNSKSSIMLSALGLLIGYFIILLSISIYLMVNSTINQDKTLFSKDFLVINKKVSFLNTISMAKSDFTPQELKEIRSQPFVKSISPFISNTYKIGAYTETKNNIPGFYTELFFQSIPANFLNIRDQRWDWKEGDMEIPIIFPGDYLKLYNFGFAKSQGLPQISAETISKVSFNVKVQGQGKTKVFSARIIGLTDKVNSILVPKAFMDWANKNYGDANESQSSSMLLLETKNNSDPALFAFLNDHFYETNTERIKNSKTSVFLRLLFYVLLGIGLLITILSLLLFILSLNLIVVKSKDEIAKLFHLGFHINQVLRFYGILLAVILILVASLALVLIYFGISVFSDTMSSAGFATNTTNFLIIFGYAVLLTIVVYVINILSLRAQLRRIN